MTSNLISAVPSPAEVIKTSQELAKQDNNVLVIVILIVLGFVFAIVIREVARYFIKQHEAWLADHKKMREEYHNTFETLIAQDHVLMAQTKDAMVGVREELRLFREAMLKLKV